MKKIYTYNDIKNFSRKFKTLPEVLTIEKVHQLIHNPPARARWRTKFNVKPLIFILMTSLILAGLLSLYINQATETNDSPNATNQNAIMVENVENENKNVVRSQEATNSRNDISNNTVSAIIGSKNTQKDIEKSVLTDTVLDKVRSEDAAKSNAGKGLNWPADTILESKQFYVDLTDEELEKLGIHNIKGNLFYCNKSGKYITCDWLPKELDHLEKDTTYHSFKRVFTTSKHFNNHKAFYDHREYHNMDTLLPVIVSVWDNLDSLYKEDIWWFTVNKELFEVLPKRYKYLEEIYSELRRLKKQHPEHLFINYFDIEKRSNSFINTKKLELNLEELKKFGFEFIQDTLTVKELKVIVKEKYKNYSQYKNRMEKILKRETLNLNDTCIIVRNIFRLKNNKSHSVIEAKYKKPLNSDFGGTFETTSYSNEIWKSDNIKPELVTDTLGRVASVKKDSVKQDSINYNLLIPIKINFAQFSFFEKQNKEEYLFWYKPTPKFFELLPDYIRFSLKNEYDAIIDNKTETASSCTYFEVCKSTLQINKYSVYPNPASKMLNIEFTLSEEIEGSFHLIDLGGNPVQTFLSASILQQGVNTFTFEIKDIAPGIYILMLQTNKGFRTQRLIVTE